MMALQVQSKRIYWHLLLVLSLFSAAIGTGGYFFFDHQKKNLKQKEWNQLAAIADLKAGQIANWRQERLGDGAIIMETPFFHNHARQLLGGSAAKEDKQAFLEWMSLWQKVYHYQNIFLLDTRGMVRLSIPEGKGMSEPYARTLALEAMQERKVLFSDLHRDETLKEIHIDLFVPIFGAGGKKNPPVGALLLEIDPFLFLYPLIQSWPTPSRSSESLLIRPEGSEVVFLNELRHRRDTALKLSFSMDEQRVKAMAAPGKEGIVEGIDYRGVPVVRAVRRVPDSPWLLVAKLDQEEIYGPIHEQAWYIGILIGVLITGAGLSVGFLWHRQEAVFFQKQYEGELERRALAQHFDYLSRYANDIILLMDQDLKIIEVNDRATESYGYTREELLRMHDEDLQSLGTKSILVEQRSQLDDLGGIVFETLQRRKDGTSFWAESSSRVIEVEGKRFYQSILRDITERKRAEQALAKRAVQLESMNRELAALNADLDDFTNVASHDLQEPLRTLTAYSDMLQKDLGSSLSERTAQDLGFITDAAKRMQMLIRSLLALAHAGRAAKKREKVSLRECAGLALEALAMRVKETEAQVIYDKLPDVWGDSTLLTQLYQNLIGNALKFRRDQYPVIQLTFEELDGSQVFGVKDNGIGIDPRYAREVFKPFRRLHGQAEYEGAGVGLAICRKIVERHGGEIWVESEPGKGAHVRFTFSHRKKEG